MLVDAFDEGLSVANESAKVFHQQHEVKIVAGHRLETEMAIEIGGGRIDGMNENCACGHDVCGMSHSKQSILQQRFSQTFALLGFVHSKAGQKEYRDGMVGQALCDACGD